MKRKVLTLCVLFFLLFFALTIICCSLTHQSCIPSALPVHCVCGWKQKRSHWQVIQEKNVNLFYRLICQQRYLPTQPSLITSQPNRDTSCLLTWVCVLVRVCVCFWVHLCCTVCSRAFFIGMGLCLQSSLASYEPGHCYPSEGIIDWAGKVLWMVE